jgi:tetratricopeptide (TPR) repeat protein
MALLTIGFEAAQHGDYVRAIEYARRANGLFEWHSFVDLAGSCYECLGRFSDAARCYDEARQLCWNLDGANKSRVRSAPYRLQEYKVLTIKSARAYLRAAIYDFAFERSSKLIRFRLSPEDAPARRFGSPVEVAARVARLVSGLQVLDLPEASTTTLEDAQWLRSHGMIDRAKYAEFWDLVTPESSRDPGTRAQVLAEWERIDIPNRRYNEAELVDGPAW